MSLYHLFVQKKKSADVAISVWAFLHPAIIGFVPGRSKDVSFRLNYESILAAAPFLEQKLFFYEQVDSTNLQARRLIKSGVEDAVIIANTQTAGRGRLNRGFVSHPGGLYISFILPMPTKQSLPTIAAACATGETLIHFCSGEIQYKWVNDLLLNGFKIAGILSESTRGFAIIGIGINVNTDPELLGKGCSHAGTLSSLCNRAFVVEEIAAMLVKNILLFWQTPNGELLESYRGRLLTLGKKIVVHDKGLSYPAVAVGLDDDAALLVLPDGEKCVRRLVAGDVSIRGFYGYHQ